MRVALTVEQSWHVVPGGIATTSVELMRALQQRGDVALVGVAAHHRFPPPRDLTPPIPVRRFPLPRRALYGAWQWLRAPKVERATGDVDVVHDLGYVVPPSNAPLVATVHDLLFLTYPAHYTRPSRLVLRRGLELAGRHARLVVCPSATTMRACEDLGFESARLRVVPWGVRTPDIDPVSSSTVLRRYGLDRPFVLFCGTLEPRKNLGRTLEAFRRVNPSATQLVLAGPRGWKQELDGQLGHLGAKARWLGHVPRHDLDALYAEAVMLVYPSLAEGFGLPVLEAMALGTPVVTSAGTAMEEVAGDTALLVDPLDVDSIAAGIERLLDDHDLAVRLGDAGRSRAAGFTWERTAAMMRVIYAEVSGSAS